MGKSFESSGRASDWAASNMLPVFSQAGAAIVKDQTQALVDKILLQALIKHADTGRFPASINEMLGAGIDPFSKSPLSIKSSAGAIRVYGAGEDGVDHGGLRSDEMKSGSQGGDIVAAYPPIPPRGVRR